MILVLQRVTLCTSIQLYVVLLQESVTGCVANKMVVRVVSFDVEAYSSRLPPKLPVDA